MILRKRGASKILKTKHKEKKTSRRGMFSFCFSSISLTRRSDMRRPHRSRTSEPGEEVLSINIHEVNILLSNLTLKDEGRITNKRKHPTPGCFFCFSSTSLTVHESGRLMYERYVYHCSQTLYMVQPKRTSCTHRGMVWQG
jgi:hypothetical protein